MSKKIKINIPNKVRPNLVSLFREYIVRKSKEPKFSYGCSDYYDDSMLEYWNRIFPGWDDDPEMNDKWDDDREMNDEDVIFPFNQSYREENFSSSKKKKKHHTRSKSKRTHLFGFPNVRRMRGLDEDDEYNFDDIDLDYTKEDGVDDEYCVSKINQCKEIWFYPDYHVKENKIKFENLKDFSDYCDDMGYYVSTEVRDSIIWQYESHCCIYPKSLNVGLMEVMCEESYGSMYFEACEEDEL